MTLSSAHSLLRQTIPNTHFPSPTARSPPPAPRCSPLPGLSQGTGLSVLLALGGGHEPTMSLPSFAPQSRARHGMFFQFFFFILPLCASQAEVGDQVCASGAAPRSVEHREHPQSHERRGESPIPLLCISLHSCPGTPCSCAGSFQPSTPQKHIP